jgi:hypothetical protein
LLAAVAAPLLIIISAGICRNLWLLQRLDQAVAKSLPEIITACFAIRKSLSNERLPLSLSCSNPAMPKAIRHIKCQFISFDHGLIVIEMHSGFDHFGLRMRQDRKKADQWQILRYWEGGETLLMTASCSSLPQSVPNTVLLQL